MTSYGRPLVKAAVAGGLLCGFSFVPSANAISGAQSEPPAQVEVRTHDEPRLADTGGFNSTPYLVGGVGFLSVGGLLIVDSVRRSRTMRYG